MTAPLVGPTEYRLWFPNVSRQRIPPKRSGKPQPAWYLGLPHLQDGVMQRWERTAYRQHWRQRALDCLLEAGWRPDHAVWQEAGIEYVRRSSAACDYVNLVSSAKAPIDALIDRVIEDDDDAHLPVQQFRREKTARIDAGCLLRVWRIR